MPQLFTKDEAPRRKPIKRMHVYEAGLAYWQVHMVCDHCGYDDGFQEYYDKTLTELKRGLPCPECNKERETP